MLVERHHPALSHPGRCASPSASLRRSRPIAERQLLRAAQRCPCPERDQLVEAFLPLIASVARTYRVSPSIERAELMHEGVVGLLRALQRYDPEMETPFWAYASWWVRQAMQQLVSEMIRPVVLSDRAARQLARINHARRDHAVRHGGQATTSALESETGLSAGQIDSLTAASLMPRHLNEPVPGAGDSTLGDQLADARAEDPYDRVLQRLAAETVPGLLAELDDRERVIVRGRFGVDGAEKTLQDLAGALGVSAERVRQLEARAIDKLRVLADSPPPAA
ncbi:MAG: polymerase primary sigma factor [Gaiellales bacterium]|nr:polymerase primary sigma factor [Gaiellales bacterium]